jgi:short-subunit dehydrogenase
MWRTRLALVSGAGLALMLAERRLQRRRLTGARAGHEFAGMTALVTGGSRGLGLLLARELGTRGARVAICARDDETLRRAQRDLEHRGIEALVLPADVTAPGEIAAVVRRVEERWGDIDVLVNNAGVITVGPLDTMTEADYEEEMATHFWAPLHAVHAVLPGMRRHGGGRIVNISSIGGKIAVPHLVPYTASKFALAGLSEGLRVELARDNIVVTTVYPGLMRTGSARHARFKGRHRAEYVWFSLSASLPGVSMGAERAARRIVEACARGQAELVLSLPAKLAVAFHVRFPNLSAALRTGVARLLPGPGGIGTCHAKGEDSESLISRSPLTTLGHRAAERANQAD